MNHLRLQRVIGMFRQECRLCLPENPSQQVSFQEHWSQNTAISNRSRLDKARFGYVTIAKLVAKLSTAGSVSSPQRSQCRSLRYSLLLCFEHACHGSR